MKSTANSGGSPSPHAQPPPLWLWRAITWKPFGTWTRFRLSRREVLIRALLSTLPLLLFVVTSLAELSASGPFDVGSFFWPAVWFFVAWRFFRLGLYTSRWGVRVSNPGLTYWYPWNRIDHFTTVDGAESFLPKSKIVALVTKSGRHRPIYAFSNKVAFFTLTEAHQSEILEDLDRRLVQAASD